MSSANKAKLVRRSGRGKSAIIMLNSMGLRTHPCGTPLFMVRVVERESSIFTLTVLLVRKLLNQFNMTPLILNFVTLYRRPVNQVSS